MRAIETLVGARIAEHRQGGGGSLRRRARRHAARRRRARSTRCRSRSAATTCARSSPGGPRRGAAARPLRHGLGRRPDRAHAAARGGRPAVRPRRLRHEGGIAWRMLGDARRCGTRPPLQHRRWSCCGRPTKRSAARRRARRIEARGARERRGPGARAVAARRRREDTPQGLRRVRADRATASPRTRASIRRKGASAIHELAHQIVALEALAGSRRGDQRQRRRRRGRNAGRTSSPRTPTPSIDVRVADDGGRGAGRGGDPRAAAERPGGALEITAASTGRRSNGATAVARLYRAGDGGGSRARPRPRRGRDRRRVGREFHRRARCSDIRRPRARRATVRTRCTSTS